MWRAPSTAASRRATAFRRRIPAERGAALLEALAALVLLALVATGAGSLAQRAARIAEEAARLDAAREAGEALLARLAAVSWYRLPELFGGNENTETARVATGGAGAPADWEPLAERLPHGRIEARLTGLARDGRRSRFSCAIALRLEIRIAYDEHGGRRSVTLVATRF